MDVLQLCGMIFFQKSKNASPLDIQETRNSKCWDIMDNDRFTYANCDAYDEDSPAEVVNIFPVDLI